MVKKIIVISNSHIDNKNKYFYIFNELKEKKILIDFFTVKEKNKILKLNTKKYTYFIDLLLTPDLSIKNPRYKKLLYNINEQVFDKNLAFLHLRHSPMRENHKDLHISIGP